jgi:hypothetical protein
LAYPSALIIILVAFAKRNTSASADMASPVLHELNPTQAVGESPHLFLLVVLSEPNPKTKNGDTMARN